MCQVGELAKSRRNMGAIEMIVREVELLKMMEGEEGAIGMEGAIKHAASKVQCSDMPGFQVTRDPIPQAAVCTLFPRLCLGMLATP
ncbi:hypothetical protein NC653_028531 [Populus alba x Populus x berolinensis]|uniref:Uncharacterized protein n=1 Tax=Populus alba x Populus x berolinensis TaxID=444605 RepID=A0AAD6M023_9ROSI|nr:hypothetical protein NC653_028531 [Populus alba x Populus x berolinensis]